MSDAEIEVETVSYKVLPKEVVAEIGTVKLLYEIILVTNCCSQSRCRREDESHGPAPVKHRDRWACVDN